MDLCVDLIVQLKIMYQIYLTVEFPASFGKDLIEMHPILPSPRDVVG